LREELQEVWLEEMEAMEIPRQIKLYLSVELEVAEVVRMAEQLRQLQDPEEMEQHPGAEVAVGQEP
jgi:hypothetical protein